MGFFKDIFSNFFAFVFALLGVASIGFAFVSCAIGGLVTDNPFIPFIIFLVIGLILLATARAFAKRG